MLRPDCPCGSGEAYDACCGRLHRGAALAATPVELMRARYAAYALGETDFVWTTWHPRTRPASPADLAPTPGVTWTGLEVHDHGEDWVDFTARFEAPTGPGAMHERSRFERRARRWVYVDGELSSR